MLEFIFHIGVIVTVFGLLRFFIFLFLFLSNPAIYQSRVFMNIYRTLDFYFVISCISLYSYQFLSFKDDKTSYLLLLISGGITLFFYLLGRVKSHQLQFNIQLNREQIKLTETTQLQQQLFIGGGLVLYFLSLTYPNVFYYPFLDALLNFIHSIYEVPVIGWVIGLVGFFFMMSTIFKSMNAVSNFFSKRNRFEETYEEKESDKFDDYTEL